MEQEFNEREPRLEDFPPVTVTPPNTDGKFTGSLPDSAMSPVCRLCTKLSQIITLVNGVDRPTVWGMIKVAGILILLFLIPGVILNWFKAEQASNTFLVIAGVFLVTLPWLLPIIGKVSYQNSIRKYQASLDDNAALGYQMRLKQAEQARQDRFQAAHREWEERRRQFYETQNTRMRAKDLSEKYEHSDIVQEILDWIVDNWKTFLSTQSDNTVDETLISSCVVSVKREQLDCTFSTHQATGGSYNVVYAFIPHNIQPLSKDEEKQGIKLAIKKLLEARMEELFDPFGSGMPSDAQVVSENDFSFTMLLSVKNPNYKGLRPII